MPRIITAGAALMYAAARYREADQMCDVVLRVWNQFEGYTRQQLEVIEDWLKYAQDERHGAQRHLLRIVMEG